MAFFNWCLSIIIPWFCMSLLSRQVIAASGERVSLRLFWFSHGLLRCLSCAQSLTKPFGPPTSAHNTGTGSKDHTPPDLMTPSRVRIGVCLYWRSDATPGQCATPLLIPTKRAHCGGSGSWESYLQLCISATTSPKYSPFWIDWLRGEMMTPNLPQGTQPLAHGTFRWPITTKQAMHKTK